MEDWTTGFRIGGAFHAWGTLFEAVAPGRVEHGYASIDLPCPSAYGFATVYAEPTAARPDRPVITVAYELADTGAAPRYLFAELVKRLGAPDDVNRDDAPERANADSVVLHANWRRGRVSIGLSLYGAPRPSVFGPGLGKLYLSWVERDVAAAPFLADWTAANDAASAASAGAHLRIFSVQYAIHDGHFEPPPPAELALRTPDLLMTPPAIAARLSPNAFALWSDAAGTRWYLSTRCQTAALGEPDTSRLHFYDVAPARGGGYTELGTGHWSVRDAHGSGSMQQAIDALASIPGLRIERFSGNDA